MFPWTLGVEVLLVEGIDRMKPGHLRSLLAFVLPTSVLVAALSSWTAYRAEVLHEPILYSIELVPISLLLYVFFSAVWYGVSALTAALIFYGAFHPRSVWLSTMVGLAFSIGIISNELLSSADFSPIWSLICSPIFSVILFKREVVGPARSSAVSE